MPTGQYDRKEKEIKCTKCNSMFVSCATNAKYCPSCRIYHYKSIRTCKLCNKEFKIQSSSQYYCRECKNKPYFCKCGCGKRISFAKAMYAKNHINSNVGYYHGHNNKRKYKMLNVVCKICKKEFVCRSTQKRITCSNVCLNKALSIHAISILSLLRRNRMTYPEKKLMFILDDLRKMCGEEWTYVYNKYQKMEIRGLFPDFILVNKNIILEVDGERFHKDIQREHKRDDKLFKLGFSVIHIPSQMISNKKFKEQLYFFLMQIMYNSKLENGKNILNDKISIYPIPSELQLSTAVDVYAIR